MQPAIDAPKIERAKLDDDVPESTAPSTNSPTRRGRCRACSNRSFAARMRPATADEAPKADQAGLEENLSESAEQAAPFQTASAGDVDYVGPPVAALKATPARCRRRDSCQSSCRGPSFSACSRPPMSKRPNKLNWRRTTRRPRAKLPRILFPPKHIISSLLRLCRTSSGAETSRSGVGRIEKCSDRHAAPGD